MKSKKRILKIAGITVAAIIFLIVAGSFLFSYFAKKKIKSAQIGKFKLESEKVETNLFQRQITLSDAKLSTSESKNNVTIPKAKLSGIKLIKMLLSNKMVVKEFSVDGPTINFYRQQNKASSDTSSTSNGSEKKRIILIKHLEIPGLKFNFLVEKENKPDTVFSTLLDVDVWKLNTDSTMSPGYSNPAFGFERVKLFAEKGNLEVAEGLYNLSFDKLSFDTNEPDLVISSARLASPYSKYGIGQHTGVETNWYDLHIDSIRFNAINISKLMQDTALIISKTTIANIEADIFRDKHLPFPEKPDTKLPSEMLQNIPFKLHNDSLIIQDANIKYEERGKKAEKAGAVTFQSLYATLSNISNIDSLKTGQMILSANAEVMGTATLDAEFTFTSPGSSEPSTVSGTLETTDFAIFNPMLTPYVGVEIQSGQIIQLAFNYGFNNERANGDVIFQYDNLNFVMINRENDSKKLILSFLANTFVIKEQNIEGNNSYKKGEILRERNKKKAMFNYWWKSILNGLKDVAVTV